MDQLPALFDLLAEMAELVDIEEFRPALLAALVRVIPVDWITLNDIGPGPDGIVVIGEPPPPPELLDAFGAYVHQNPLVDYYRRTRNGRAMRFSDLITQDELHALDLHRTVYRPLGVEYQMSFTLPHAEDRILGVALSRGDRDFTDAERDVLDRARPFLIQAYRNAIRFTEARAGNREGPSLSNLIALGLSRRQAEVVHHLALGASGTGIAERLGISPRTVEKHLQQAYRALGVGTRAEAAAAAWSA